MRLLNQNEVSLTVGGSSFTNIVSQAHDGAMLAALGWFVAHVLDRPFGAPVLEVVKQGAMIGAMLGLTCTLATELDAHFPHKH